MSESWAKRFGVNRNQTPLAPECRYMAAALFLADMTVALLCKEGYKGVEVAEDFTVMLGNVHVGAKNYNDKAMVHMLGESMGHNKRDDSYGPECPLCVIRITIHQHEQLHVIVGNARERSFLGSR